MIICSRAVSALDMIVIGAAVPYAVGNAWDALEIARVRFHRTHLITFAGFPVRSGRVLPVVAR